MNETAAFHGPGILQSRSFWIALFVSLPLLFAGFCESASAKPHPLVGGDGKIHACYRVKGKPKGNLRVVRSHKARCRRGERKVAWAVAAVSGAPGSEGTPGTAGTDGAVGTQASVSTTLTEQVDSLTSRVDSLEATLAGITNADLLAVVDSLPTIDSLCEQSEALAEQVNLLQDVIGGLGLEPALELIGLLEIPPLPNELELGEFGCSAP